MTQMRQSLKSLTKFNIGLLHRNYRTIRKPIGNSRYEEKTREKKLTKHDVENRIPIGNSRYEEKTRGKKLTKHDGERKDNNIRTKFNSSSVQQYDIDSEPALAGFQCPGCGSKYQYTLPEKPGYVPYPVLMSWSFEEKYSNKQDYIYCSRCTEINTSKELQKYSVTEKKFDSIITAIIKERATAIIVCDITTFPMSLPPLSLIPRDLPIILCLNKCDLLSRDSEEFQKLIVYYNNVVNRTIGLKLKIEHVQLTSGHNGTGLKKLKEYILRYLFYNKERLSSSLYLLGCANAGKSTLFNKLALLLSEDVEGQSTISQWPGTTVNNVKLKVPFPAKLRKERKESSVELEKDSVKQQSFVEVEKDSVEEQSIVKVEDSEESARKWFHFHLIDQLSGEKGKHLVDTPGVLPTWDISNYLTKEGIQALHPKGRLVKRVIELAPGDSLYITSLARIDFIAGSGYESIVLTLHTPTFLPIRRGKFEEIGIEGLDIGVKGDVPSLQNKLYFVHNHPGWREPSGDIHLGALGWGSVKLMPEGSATLVVSGVNLQDINYRTPSLLL